jgi:hypothetical protein
MSRTSGEAPVVVHVELDAGGGGVADAASAAGALRLVVSNAFPVHLALKAIGYAYDGDHKTWWHALDGHALAQLKAWRTAFCVRVQACFVCPCPRP